MHLRIGALILAGALLCGCSFPKPPFGRNIELAIRLPPPPAAWEPLGRLSYRLVAFGPDWEAESELLEQGTRQAFLSIEKGGPIPVLAYPVIGGRADLLRPAGGVFPLTLDPHGILELSYPNGPLAALLVPVIQNEALARSVNIPRLRAEIWERSGGNPWLIDREAILETLLYGVMRSDRIRNLPEFVLETSLSPGSWVSDNPFEGTVEIGGAAPRSVELALPGGIHHYFLAGRGAAERIDVEIDEEGWTVLNRISGSAEFGSW